MEWRNPEESLTDKRFSDALETCLQRLSEVGRQIFLLRELMGLSVEKYARNWAFPRRTVLYFSIAAACGCAAAWLERARLRIHVAMCSACSRVERQLGFLREALSGVVKPPDRDGPDPK
jgi:hypothetical protein